MPRCRVVRPVQTHTYAVLRISFNRPLIPIIIKPLLFVSNLIAPRDEDVTADAFFPFVKFQTC